MTKSFLALILLIFSAQASAQEGCLDPDRAAALTAQFAFQRWDKSLNKGAGDWQRVSNIDLCDGNRLEQRIAGALLFLQSFPDSLSKQDDFDQNLMGNSPFQFFQQRIETIDFDFEGNGGCSGNAVAYVSAPESHNLHICPSAAALSSLVLSSVLMHESRHIDGFPHRICEHGVLIGTLSCDDSYAQGGAYGVGVEFFVRTARMETLDPVLREEARGEAVADFLNRFNEAPLNEKPGVLLVSTAGTLTFYDGTEKIELRSDIPDGTVVALRDLPAFFEPLRGEVKSLRDISQFSDTDGTVAANYRSYSPEKRAALVDVFYGDSSCLLFSSLLHCENGDDIADISLPDGLQAAQFLAVGSEAGAELLIVDRGGRKYNLPAEKDLKKWTTSEILPDYRVSLANFRSFAFLSPALRFAVTLEGTLLRYSNEKNAWVSDPAFAKEKFKKMDAPFYWSKRLQGL